MNSLLKRVKNNFTKENKNKDYKNGFTLVEVLAVIIVLAIIMLLAIPSVLDAVESSRKKTFLEYTDRIVDLAEKKNISSEMQSSDSSTKCSIYNIKNDLGLGSTGDFDGYVLVRPTDVNEDDEYIITLWDGNYILQPYNYTNKINYKNEKKNISDDIKVFDSSLKEKLTVSELCGNGCEECILPNNEVIKNKSKMLYNVLKEAAEDKTYAKEYTGEHQDSMDKSLSTKKIYHWYASDDTKANEILEMNNVIFGGYCWQMIRTTDTGGVKMIYNGVPENNKCLSIRSSKQIDLTTYNYSFESIADVGYMYNTRYNPSSKVINNAEYKYSKKFKWNGSKYILDEDTSVVFSDMTNAENQEKLNNAHYTCWNTSGECSTLSYVFLYNPNNNTIFYLNLANGKDIKDLLNEMLYNDNVNKTNSNIKTAIDTWFEDNLIEYSKYLEDTIFCNNRTSSNSETNGWNPNGGNIKNYLTFKEFEPTTDLSCELETDKFSTLNRKAKLTYKVGLMSFSEMNLLNNSKIRKTGKDYWLMSPSSYFIARPRREGARELTIDSQGDLGGYETSYWQHAVRPAISLLPYTKYTKGNGSTSSPYVVEE